MLIIDGDCPMFPAMRMRRDLTLPIDELRRRDTTPDNVAMASLPEMRRAGIAAAVVKVASDGQREGNVLAGALPPHRAYAVGQGYLAYFRALEREGQIRLLRTADAFRDHMDDWLAVDARTSAEPGGTGSASDTDADVLARDAFRDLPLGAILGMEGAHSVVAPDQLDEWWDAGVRLISLGHYGMSPYAHGTGMGTDGGLLEGAIDLLRGMDRLGIVLDVTHTSDASVREALRVFDGPVMATHSNARAICPGERQLPDDLIRAVIERDGVIGASMDTFMLYPHGNIDWGTDHWPSNRDIFPRDAVTLEDYVDHIDHVCQLAGDALHAGIGGDTDGQGGRESAPDGIDTVVDYQKIARILRGRGYREHDVKNVMYRNWQRFFERTLPGSKA